MHKISLLSGSGLKSGVLNEWYYIICLFKITFKIHHAEPLKVSQIKVFPFLCSCFVCVNSQTSHERQTKTQKVCTVIILYKSLTTQGALYPEQAILFHFLNDKFFASRTHLAYPIHPGLGIKAGQNLLHVICKFSF